MVLVVAEAGVLPDYLQANIHNKYAILEIIFLVHEAYAVSNHETMAVHFSAASIAKIAMVCSLRLQNFKVLWHTFILLVHLYFQKSFTFVAILETKLPAHTIERGMVLIINV